VRISFFRIVLPLLILGQANERVSLPGRSVGSTCSGPSPRFLSPKRGRPPVRGGGGVFFFFPRLVVAGPPYPTNFPSANTFSAGEVRCFLRPNASLPDSLSLDRPLGVLSLCFVFLWGGGVFFFLFFVWGVLVGVLVFWVFFLFFLFFHPPLAPLIFHPYLD